MKRATATATAAAGLGLAAVALLALRAEPGAERPPAAELLAQALEHHARSQQRAGVLAPMYVYPTNVHANAEYNRLIAAKRRHETVPVWTIVNPASGPGAAVDPNYTKAIDRLRGAGIVTLGYVSTAYGKRAEAEVRTDLDAWRRLYPRVQGLFFDEMLYEDTDAAVRRQAGYRRHARQGGFWPVVANPGADTPGRFFAGDCADVIVVHEGAAWPDEKRLHGDYFGGYADHPPWTRGVLLHSTATLDRAALKMARRHARWFYVATAPFRAGDPAAANPWDRLSPLLEDTMAELARDP